MQISAKSIDKWLDYCHLRCSVLVSANFRNHFEFVVFSFIREINRRKNQYLMRTKIVQFIWYWCGTFRYHIYFKMVEHLLCSESYQIPFFRILLFFRYVLQNSLVGIFDYVFAAHLLLTRKCSSHVPHESHCEKCAAQMHWSMYDLIYHTQRRQFPIFIAPVHAERAHTARINSIIVYQFH